MINGFVKSPSAALRFTPALLDQKLRIEGIGGGSDFQEEDSSWGLSHRVNRCSVPTSTLHSSDFARLALYTMRCRALHLELFTKP